MLKPGGIPIPDSMPDIASFWLASTRRTASLTAAASRSSRMSFSSDIREGSISTLRTSWRPFMVTLTRPAPDSPVTSALATSSWALCICSCICWAFFIRSPILFIMRLSPACLCGADAFFYNAPFKSFNNTLHQRILPDGLFLRFLTGYPLALLKSGQDVHTRFALLYFQLCGVAKTQSQGGHNLFFVAFIQKPCMAFVQG